MKILITGGLGYLGGRLGAFLTSNSTEVYLGSRFNQPKPSWLKSGKIVKMDFCDRNSLLKACDDMDVIIHAAGMNALECSSDPVMAFEVNGIGTGSLFQAAQQKSVSKFIYLSTAHVYSNNLAGLITEDTFLTNKHPYAFSKLAGEEAITDQYLGLGIETSILRLANAFGSPMDPKINCWMLVVNDFCKQAATERRLAIRSESNNVRNFITMTDVCSAIKHLISLQQNILSPMIYNLGDRTKSLFDIACAISEIYKKEKKIKLKIEKLCHDSSSVVGLNFQSQALNAINWQPNFEFRTELLELIEFCEVNFGCESNK